MILGDEFLEPEEVEPLDQGILPPLLPPTLQAAVNAATNIVGDISMVPVASTDIAAWGYDPMQMQLKIQFTNGRVYQYANISPMEWDVLMNAPSKGSAFWALIRRDPVAHPFMRLI